MRLSFFAAYSIAQAQISIGSTPSCTAEMVAYSLS